MHSSNRSDIAEDSYPDLPTRGSTTGYERDTAHPRRRAPGRSASMTFERNPACRFRSPAHFGSIHPYSSEIPGQVSGTSALKCSIPADSYDSTGQKCESSAAECVLPGEKYRSTTASNVIPDGFSVIPAREYRFPAIFSVIPDGKYVIPLINDPISGAFRSFPSQHTLSIILSTRKEREDCSDGNNG